MIPSYLYNKILLALQTREYRSLKRACQDPDSQQGVILRTYIDANADTLFGKRHDFKHVSNYTDFKDRVPIQEWPDIEPWVRKIAHGETNILTKNPATHFEETSGTTSYSKLIPYTGRLRKEFERGIASWMVGLSEQYPRAFYGCTYWSISPSTKEVLETQGGLKIGLDSDLQYFRPLNSYFLQKIIAVPKNLKNVTHEDVFYKETLKCLIHREDLSLLSFWSPTYFLQLDQYLSDHKSHFLDVIKASEALSSKRKSMLLSKLQEKYVWRDIWPHLDVISCWTDAQASLWIPELKKRIGNVSVQGKGLLSTEGITSVPMVSGMDPILTLRSHFYEFRDCDTDRVYLVSQLHKGGVYEVILTTGGGLYRYATSDLIYVTGFYKRCPCIRFVGRENNTSDLVGEKISEYQVNEALTTMEDNIKELFSLAFMYPVSETNQAGYSLFVEFYDRKEIDVQKHLVILADHVSASLRKNPYYFHAVKMKQLRDLNVIKLNPGFKDQLVQFLKNKTDAKEGMIKIPALFKNDTLKPVLRK